MMDNNTEVKMEIEAMKNLSIYHLVRFPAGYNTEAPNTVYPTILALYGHGNLCGS